MKVAVYAPNYLPATRHGGPIQSVHGLARALVQHGCEVDVYTTDNDGGERLPVPLDKATDIDGVQVRYFATAPPRRVYRSPGLHGALERSLPQADILHINGTYLLPGPGAATIARRCGTPYVHSPRGMLSPDLIAGKSRVAKTCWIGLLERKALAGASAIHATSEREAAGLRHLGLALAPIRIIGNGTDVPTVATSDGGDRFWHGVAGGRRVAMCGRLDWMKGVDLAIRAVAALPDVHLRIAGPDIAGLWPTLDALAGTLRASHRVAFLGGLEPAAKWDFLRGADVVLVPSVTESFGMTVIETLLAATPVIATESVGASAVIRRIDADCVVRRDVATLTEALRALLADGARRHRIGAAGAALVETEFGWRSIAAQMLDLYRDIIERRRRPPRRAATEAR